MKSIRCLRKAQASLEFLIIMTIFLFFFVSFIGLFNYYSHQIEKSNKQAYLSDISTNLQQELQFAQSLETGFHRKLLIPATINGNNYKIKIMNSTYLGSGENLSEIVVSYTGSPKGNNPISVALVSGNVIIKKPIVYGNYNNISVPHKNTVYVN